MRKVKFGLVCAAAIPGAALARPVIFQGGLAAESAWRAAAGGNVPLESFESYFGLGWCAGQTDAVTALPALGVVLYGASPGRYPGTYVEPGSAHTGTHQLANFGYNQPCTPFVDYFIAAAPGRVITAVGLWQCDPQGHLTVVAEDAGGAAMFSFVALINNGSGQSFGGFVSSVPVARLRVLGAEGDGWNHLDDLQIVTVLVGSACNLADITEVGGTPEAPGSPDQQLTVDDIIVFINLFSDSTGCPGSAPCSLADICGVGGPPELPDGELTVDDVIAFFNAFADGC